MSDKLKVPYQREIENQALTFLHDYALIAFFSFVVSHTVLGVLIYHYWASPAVIVWITFIWITQALSLLYRRKLPLTNLPHNTKLKRGMIINIVDGFIIASCLLFFPFVDDILRMLIITLLLIACTGAITTTVGYLRFYLAFSLPILISNVIAAASSALFFDGSHVLLVIAFISLLVIYPLVKVSTAIFQHFREAFAANLRNHEINKELEGAMTEAKQANESKTRFLASASHDLRQPINTLSLFVANLSLKDTQGEYSEIVGHMNTAINSIDAQLESLLDISKLDAGIVQVNNYKTDIGSLMQELVKSYQNQLTDQVKIRYQDLCHTAVVSTDIVLFERIVSNLISNAVKYTPKGFIDINLINSEQGIKLEIKDTGIGINEENLNKIFDEFYQVGNPERSGANGLGLGLSIVKRLASLLNIELNLDSKLGIGTIVTLCIPSSSTQELTQPNNKKLETIEEIEKKKKRIIALDNETGILVAVRSVLETMGHDVETYTDSKQALLSFQENLFDLALIDYRLSGPLNGGDVIHQMQSMNAETKFFLVTGDSNIKKSDSEFEVIYKPVTSKKLEYIFNG